MIKHILMDCDGVLFDFTNHALRAHGALGKRDTLARGEYSIGKQLGITEEEFWTVIDQPVFWGTVRPYPMAVKFIDSLVGLAALRNFSIAFCTSSSHNVGAFSRARDTAIGSIWNKAIGDRPHPGYPPVYICARGGKGIFGGPDRLLVDDMPKNCKDFEAAGGVAIMPRMPWNCLDPEASYDGPDYVKLFEEIKGKVGEG